MSTRLTYRSLLEKYIEERMTEKLWFSKEMTPHKYDNFRDILKEVCKEVGIKRIVISVEQYQKGKEAVDRIIEEKYTLFNNIAKCNANSLGELKIGVVILVGEEYLVRKGKTSKNCNDAMVFKRMDKIIKTVRGINSDLNISLFTLG